MAYDEQLARRVRRALTARGVAFEEKPMMGGLCFMVDGKMCVGVEKQRLMVRLDPEKQHAALRRLGCVPMDFTGRPMRGFVFVNGEGTASGARLASWLDLALKFNPRAVASKRRASASKRTAAKARGRGTGSKGSAHA